jgi:hypothetical protein
MIEKEDKIYQQARLSVKRNHIVLASRIMKMHIILPILIQYGINKEMGVEAIAEVLDRLEEERKLTIDLEMEELIDETFEIWNNYFLLDNNTGKRVKVPEMGRLGLEDTFGKYMPK